MHLNELKLGGFYKLEAVVVTRDDDDQVSELLVKATAVRPERGIVEVTFPPMTESRWTTPNKLSPLG